MTIEKLTPANCTCDYCRRMRGKIDRFAISDRQISIEEQQALHGKSRMWVNRQLNVNPFWPPMHYVGKTPMGWASDHYAFADSTHIGNRQSLEDFRGRRTRLEEEVT